VESCTAIGEHPDGRFEIITWTHSATAGQVGEEAEKEVEEAA
jgi:hypothetical protein